MNITKMMSGAGAVRKWFPRFSMAESLKADARVVARVEQALMSIQALGLVDVRDIVQAFDLRGLGIGPDGVAFYRDR